MSGSKGLRHGLAAVAVLVSCSASVLADGAQKTTPLAVNPVVLPTPEVPTVPLSAAPDAPVPKVAKKQARSGKASSTKAKAPGRSKSVRPPAKKRAQRK